jgi:hypothetical protein
VAKADQTRDLAALALGESIRRGDLEVGERLSPAQLGEDPPEAENPDIGRRGHHDKRDDAEDRAGDHERAASTQAGAGAVARDPEERARQHDRERAHASDVSEVFVVTGSEPADPDRERDRQRRDEGHEHAELGKDHEPDVAAPDLGHGWWDGGSEDILCDGGSRGNGLRQGGGGCRDAA